MTIEEDKAVVTDLEELVEKSVDRMVKPTLILSCSTEERIIKRIDRLEDLVIHKRLFYRKVVLKVFMFIVLTMLTG